MRYFTYTFISILIIAILPLSCNDISSSEKTIQPDLENFANSAEFKKLVNVSKKVMLIHNEHFQQVPKDKKPAYIKKIRKLTKILRNNPTEENLRNFVKHAGFKEFSKFLQLSNAQKFAHKNLNTKYPGYADLAKFEKEKFILKANAKIGNDTNSKFDIISGPNYAQTRDAAIRSAESEAYVGLIACGATAGASASFLGPIGAGAAYGACAGLVYSKRDADLELAQLNYEACILDQQ